MAGNSSASTEEASATGRPASDPPRNTGQPGRRSSARSEALSYSWRPLAGSGLWPADWFITLIHLGIGLGGVALRLVQVNFKARDDSALGRFWAEALGWGVSSEGPDVTNVEPVGFAWPDPVAVCVDVVTVPDPETVKYRVHLDLATTSAAHQAELVARLRDLGATPADVGQGDVPWTVLADPEGNEFCVLTPG